MTSRSVADRVASIVQAWSVLDRGVAITDLDRSVIASTEAARAGLVERAIEGPATKDFFDAAAIYGRALAAAGASPSFSAQAIDTLTEALDAPRTPWARGARAALAEGYASSQAEVAHRTLVDAWTPPHCVVRLDEDNAAITTSFPSDDPEELGAWAERVAHGLSRAGVRQVVLNGEAGEAPAALREALEIAGIAIRPVEARRRSWFPWKR